MPTRRTALKRAPKRRISEAAIDAWKRCDYLGLHRELGLHTAHHSPLPLEVTVLGVGEDEPPPTRGRVWDRSWEAAIGLQRELIAVAGWPSDCRKAYEKNLADAQSWAAYCQTLVDHPERGGLGTGCDEQSRQEQLERALDGVAWREELLRELAE